MILAVAFALVAPAPAVTPAAATARSSSASVARPAADGPLGAWIDSVRREHNIPAMAVVVVRADTVLARGVAGVRRSGVADPVTLQDRFQLGSNTKAITATVLATLVEEGRLAWTSTPGEVFPELRDSISSGFQQVTLEQLLSHHGGVSPFTETEDKDFRSIPGLVGTPMERRRAFTAWVLHGKPIGPTGAQAVYSNGGYTVAAAMGERVTGEAWESLVRERIFAPLGIYGTFAWSDSADVHQPWGHYETRSGVRAVDPRDPSERVPPIIWPAGAIELSLDDYARFLQLNLRGLQRRDTPLLRVTTIQHLHTPPTPPGDNFALGWGIQDFDGARVSVHVGSAGTFYAVAIVLPARDLAVAVFANAGGERAAAATRDALKALVRHDWNTTWTTPTSR